MTSRMMTNAAMLLMMASCFNFSNQLVLPNEETNNYQSVLKANKDGTEIQNGIKYDDKTINRVIYDIEELKDMKADENAKNDTARKKDILESNVKNYYNAPNIILIADRGDISKYRYKIDANTDEKNNKLRREGSSTFNADISELIKNQPRTTNKRRNSAKSDADRVENNNNVYGIDVNEKAKNNKHARDISRLKANQRLDSVILRSNTVETKISTGTGFLNLNTENTKNSDSIKFRFETPKGSGIDTSKRRLKRYGEYDEYDDDLYIWDNCEGKKHLAFIDGDFKCVEMSLDNRTNFGTLSNCPAGTRRVFFQNNLILCLPRKKRCV